MATTDGEGSEPGGGVANVAGAGVGVAAAETAVSGLGVSVVVIVGLSTTIAVGDGIVLDATVGVGDSVGPSTVRLAVSVGATGGADEAVGVDVLADIVD